ncbi:meiosis-specific with OB domain-containing protein isoform X2 [Agrilus planipennis]|uniref:Meiosis-specific with OB domain-containing protein isoform X2 n=1 Tax=Agrilus planipennis TaxID=224129 RepID=A0A1W4WL02_AGRPL|nr:meiosis-specific with OB domain-containing protein isoform X2 [Agrilus planipennis]
MDQTNISLQRATIKELSPIITNAIVVGIIIAKQRLRRFVDNKDTFKERGVWNFTIRDSIVDYINVTCWGDANEIIETYDKYHTGDVIEITKPRIDVRKVGDIKEQYCPMVTSPFHLTINVPSMAKHETNNYDYYSTLLRHPTKPIVGVINLIDVHNSGGGIASFVDLLGAIRTVGPIRIITTKVGNEQQVRDVVILDHTHPGLKITLWDPEMIARYHEFYFL